MTKDERIAMLDAQNKSLQERNSALVERIRRLETENAQYIAEIRDKALDNRFLRFSKSPAAMIREFMDKYKQPRADRPALPDFETRIFRWQLLKEEYNEYFSSEFTIIDGDFAEEMEMDIPRIADALADMVYVIYGTAETYGIPLDRVIAEVHRSNMTKTASGPMQKPVKGPDYQPPRIAEILGGKE